MKYNFGDKVKFELKLGKEIIAREIGVIGMVNKDSYDIWVKSKRTYYKDIKEYEVVEYLETGVIDRYDC